MIDNSAHHKFLLLVHTAAIVKDIQKGTQLSALTVAHVFNLDMASFADFEDDYPALAGMANHFVEWQHGERLRPSWAVFYSGEYV